MTRPRHSSPSPFEEVSALGGTSRRHFLAGLGVGLAGTLLGPALLDPWAPAAASTVPTAPHETVRHARTWMAWPSSRGIWGSDLAGVQRDIALIARTIAEYEPVTLCATSATAASTARSYCGSAVRVIADIPVNDCWMRDTGPLFTLDGSGTLGARDLYFNGWGAKQNYSKDQYVASRVAAEVGVSAHPVGFTSEPGAIETDGDGTLLATESSIINENRNPGKTKAQLTSLMIAAYGARKVIWVPGVRGQDITDDHIDATSRFIRPGVVLVQLPPSYRDDVWARDARRQYDILSRATDARGRRLQVATVTGPDTVRPDSPDFLDSYVNFYTVNGAVITAQFGDSAKDSSARAVLARAFPGRVVRMLDVDRLHAGGGGIHCVTQHQPAP